jgi:signal peptidase
VSRAVSWAFTLLTAFAIGVALLLIVIPVLFGYERYVITGGSMEPTIHKGSVAFDEVVPVADLKVGDVITFVPPESWGASPVTHRITGVTRDELGRPVFSTQGDANEYADPWQVSLPGASQARYSFQIPCLGYVLAALTLRPVRLLVLAVPALLIGVSLLVSVWREAVAEARREREATLGLETVEAGE